MAYVLREADALQSSLNTYFYCLNSQLNCTKGKKNNFTQRKSFVTEKFKGEKKAKMIFTDISGVLKTWKSTGTTCQSN